MSRTLLQTSRQVVDLCNRLGNYPRIGLDTEFSGPLLVAFEAEKQEGKKRKGKGPKKPKRTMVNPYRATLTGISVGLSPEESFYAPIGHRIRNISVADFALLTRAISEYQGVCVIHNGKAERRSIGKGPVPATLPLRIADTLVACWLAGYKSLAPKNPYALKQLGKRVGRTMTDFETVTKGLDFSQMDPADPAALEYACEDAEAPLLLWDEVLPIIQSWGLESLFWDVEMPFMHLTAEMEDAGMAVDKDRMEQVDRSFLHEVIQCDEDYKFLMADMGPANWKTPSLNSPKQLQWFFDEGHWPKELAPVKKTGFGVDTDTIDAIVEATEPGSLGHEAALLKQKRGLVNGLRSKYTRKLVLMAHQHPDLRLHPTIHQTGTDTTRLSVSDPPMQQLPKRDPVKKRVREGIVARDGHHLLSADYSQIELRVLAHWVGTGKLFEAYRDGADAHAELARELADLLGWEVSRDDGKTANFSTVYSVGPKKFGRKLGMSTEEAKQFLARFKDLRPEVFAFFDRLRDDCANRGYTLTMGGHRRYLPLREARERLEDLKSQGHRWANSPAFREALLDVGSEERKAGNTPIQGSAAHLMKLAMLKFRSQVDVSRCPVVMQIHDDLIVEPEDGYLEEAKEILQHSMESIGRDLELRVPLVAEPAWAKRMSDL